MLFTNLSIRHSWRLQLLKLLVYMYQETLDFEGLELHLTGTYNNTFQAPLSLLPGRPSEISHCCTMTGEQSNDVVQPLLPGIVQGSVPFHVFLRGIAAPLQDQGTHVHPATGRCVVEGGAALRGWNKGEHPIISHIAYVPDYVPQMPAGGRMSSPWQDEP